jgi:4-coumarate--CoA ligase
VEEIVYQLKLSKTTFIIAHSTVLEVALKAAQAVSLPSDRIVLLDYHASRTFGIVDLQNISDLIILGNEKKQAPYERPLNAGEGKTKIALLCWSSGTTGKPKVLL